MIYQERCKISISDIRFKTAMLKSSLCNDSDEYILGKEKNSNY